MEIQSHADAVHALFAHHLEIDAQIGASISRVDSKAAPLLDNALRLMAGSGWRSADDGDTVAHALLAACAGGNLHELATVELVDSVLEVDAALLTTPNLRNITPTGLAMQCARAPQVERRYTVIVHGNYQLLSPENPMYKSPTAEVHECTDLRVSEAQRGQQRLALKLIANGQLWQRELEVRTMLTGSGGGLVAALFRCRHRACTARCGAWGRPVSSRNSSPAVRRIECRGQCPNYDHQAGRAGARPSRRGA